MEIKGCHYLSAAAGALFPLCPAAMKGGNGGEGEEGKEREKSREMGHRVKQV